MFRRFFKRDGEGKKNDQEQDADRKEQMRKTLQEHADQGQDDGVHRMVVRTGDQPLPEDPDEQIYDKEQGEHAEIARNALQAGDFKRSIYHLGLALASDPMRDDWLALLDQWIAVVGSDALDLVPLNDEQYFATLQTSQELMRRGNTPTHRMEAIPLVGKHYHAKVAVHAYILAAQGKLKEAIALLLQLIQVKPEIPYALWLPRWQDQPEFAEALEPEKVAPVAMSILRKYSGTYV